LNGCGPLAAGIQDPYLGHGRRSAA
jgi:hypothetical protein